MMKTPGRFILAIILVCFSVACSTGAADTPSTPAPPHKLDYVRGITLDDLFAANLRVNEIEQITGQTGAWWPTFPSYLHFDIYSGGISPDKGEKYSAGQAFALVGGSNPVKRISASVNAFVDEQTGSESITAKENAAREKGTLTAGPAVGDQSTYYLGTETDAYYQQAPNRVTLWFRLGNLLGDVTAYSSATPGENAWDAPATLAQFAAPMAERMKSLLAGQSLAVPLPAKYSSPLPDSAVPGPVLGSAVVPVDAWAMYQPEDKNKQSSREWLLGLGAKEIVYRQYGLVEPSEHAVHVHLFSFKAEKNASDWVNVFAKEIGNAKLDPGNTGKSSAFSDDGGWYQLWFAKGHNGGIVLCGSPYGAKTDPACGVIARRIAEQWYAVLP